MKTLSLLIGVISTVMFLLSGCGLKNDLYIPEQSSNQTVQTTNNQ